MLQLISHPWGPFFPLSPLSRLGPPGAPTLHSSTARGITVGPCADGPTAAGGHTAGPRAEGRCWEQTCL